MSSLANVISLLTTLLSFVGCGYFLVCLWAARAFVRESRKPAGDFHPPVSIIKPVKGLDPEMYESFASHCRQQYGGDYELLFAAGSEDDPAIPAIDRLKCEFPEREIRLVVCPKPLGANGKMSSVAQALPEAQYGHILINDSDILVSPWYLQQIMAGFAAIEGDRPVGMVTALYRGKAYGTLGSRLEALGMATDFAPSVLAAKYLERGIRFGLGSTLAVSREALDRSGGLLPLVEYLADDYQLGSRIAQAGYDVRLSREVVETSVPAYSFGAFFVHQVRWARTVRDARPFSYIGLVFSYGLSWAVLNVIAAGASVESLALLSTTLAARAAVALLVGTAILGDRKVLRDLWLLPLRDLSALVVWAWSYAGNSIWWRGKEFRIRRGKLTELPEGGGSLG